MISPSVQEALRSTPNPIVFEIGSCDGVYTNELVKCCTNGKPKFYSFEPDPRNLYTCIKNMPACVTFIPAAIGNVTFETVFHLAAQHPNGSFGSSSLSAFKDVAKEFPWCQEVGTTVVMCYRLDDFCDIFKISEEVDLIFMDVQGAERLVIEGAQKTLARTRYLWTEFDAKEGDGAFYKDSSSLSQLKTMLPDWDVLEILGGDALFGRKETSAKSI